MKELIEQKIAEFREKFCSEISPMFGKDFTPALTPTQAGFIEFFFHSSLTEVLSARDEEIVEWAKDKAYFHPIDTKCIYLADLLSFLSAGKQEI